MTDNFGRTSLETGYSSKTNRIAELCGFDSEDARPRFIDYKWEDESSGAYYNIVLYEDGDIEVEGREPIRLFANSPWEEFTYSNTDSHISELEKGSHISRREELEADPDNVKLDENYEVEEMPWAGLTDLSELTDLIKKGQVKMKSLRNILMI